jgi:hypothetical protein
MKKYDRIVFVRSLDDVEDDGARDIDKAYQQSIEGLMSSLLVHFDHLELHAASIDERLALMTRYILSPTGKSVV